MLSLAGDELFSTGSFELDTERRRGIVNDLSDALDNILPCNVAAARAACASGRSPILETVLVEGHTDKQPYRRPTNVSDTRDPNDELSTRRALTVFAALLKRQDALDALSNSDGQKVLAFSGYGARRPLSDALGDTPADYQRNRRIDIRFVLSTRTSEEFEKLRRQIRQALGGATP